MNDTTFRSVNPNISDVLERGNQSNWRGMWKQWRVICCAASDLQQGTVLSETWDLQRKKRGEKTASLPVPPVSSVWAAASFMRKTLLLITIFTSIHRSKSECFCHAGLAWWPSLTRPDGWFYLTFAKLNQYAKLQGCWQLCFLPRRRPKGSHVAFPTLKTPLYVHQQSFSRWLMAIKSERAVYVTAVSLGGLFKWIYTICFLGGDAVLQRYSDLWHLP